MEKRERTGKAQLRPLGWKKEKKRLGGKGERKEGGHKHALGEELVGSAVLEREAIKNGNKEP